MAMNLEEIIQIKQLNLSTMANYGAELSGHCREVAIVGRI